MSLRRILKRTVLLIVFVPVAPLVAIARGARLLGREGIFVSLAALLSLIPGKTGSYLRLAYYKGTLSSISSDVAIGFGSFFTRADAEVGEYVSIGNYCVLGRVSLADHVVIASRVSIPSGRHQHARRFEPDHPSETLLLERVTVGKNCWIGEGAIVLANLGEGCIVAAGSVVAREVPAGRVVGGNPASVLREAGTSNPVERRALQK